MSTIAAPPVQKTPPQRALTFLAHVDATPQDLEPAEVAEVDHFEKAFRPDAQVRVELSRTSTSPWKRIALGALGTLALPLSWSLAGSLGPLGLPLAAVGTLVGMEATQMLAEGLRGAIMHREPSWNGTRVYDIGPDVTKGRLDSKIVSQSDSKKPTVDQLSRFIADGMQAYPAQVTAFMASGHGSAWQSCTGYSVSSLRKALEDAAVQSGKKVDVVILEACLMGNVEALDALKDSARYAVVSEETMGANGLPWQKIMGSLPQGTLDARTFAERIVEGSVDASGIDTLAVIDLQKVPALTQSVEKLAVELRRVVGQGGKSQVRAAFHDATAFPKGFDPLTRMEFDVRDLGELSDAVCTRVADKNAREAAEDVRNALHDAVLTSTASRKYGNASHVSVQGLQPFFKTDNYERKTGFTEWSALLKDLKRFN